MDFLHCILFYAELRWFGIKSCSLGDEGLNIIATAISQLNVQVLAFENCDLTDKSSESIGRLIKVLLMIFTLQYMK